jgi:hypothetical protein
LHETFSRQMAIARNVYHDDNKAYKVSSAREVCGRSPTLTK